MKLTLLASLLTIGLGAAFATTTDEVMLSAGGLTATITDNGSCSGSGCATVFGDLNPTPGTTLVFGTLADWTISFTSGTSHSPSDVPTGLDLGALTATCAGGAATCGSNPLHIEFSDINFDPANPEFITGYSATINGLGSTSESAYFSNCATNPCSSSDLFAETTLIGSVGPLTATGGGTATGGAGSIAPYSLTLDQTFTANGSSVSFSVDGSVASVPEPGALVLFGSVLVLCSTKLRRRRTS